MYAFARFEREVVAEQRLGNRTGRAYVWRYSRALPEEGSEAKPSRLVKRRTMDLLEPRAAVRIDAERLDGSPEVGLARGGLSRRLTGAIPATSGRPPVVLVVPLRVPWEQPPVTTVRLGRHTDLGNRDGQAGGRLRIARADDGESRDI